jgi:hypothetical protein
MLGSKFETLGKKEFIKEYGQREEWRIENWNDWVIWYNQNLCQR